MELWVSFEPSRKSRNLSLLSLKVTRVYGLVSYFSYIVSDANFQNWVQPLRIQEVITERSCKISTISYSRRGISQWHILICYWRQGLLLQQLPSISSIRIPLVLTPVHNNQRPRVPYVDQRWIHILAFHTYNQRWMFWQCLAWHLVALFYFSVSDGIDVPLAEEVTGQPIRQSHRDGSWWQRGSWFWLEFLIRHGLARKCSRMRRYLRPSPQFLDWASWHHRKTW